MQSGTTVAAVKTCPPVLSPPLLAAVCRVGLMVVFLGYEAVKCWQIGFGFDRRRVAWHELVNTVAADGDLEEESVLWRRQRKEE
ncbi:hypothetical protein Tsubulata_050173 [Turnera subulata]|uniref:Uncharacterized protein n=1 Tax=Turnera subulata TaxID=218843 RepID=A0A9Q0JBZ7_9ROSI|nr:hypothetical protein Tsubulata_050173 [Turnera subulata]